MQPAVFRFLVDGSKLKVMAESEEQVIHLELDMAAVSAALMFRRPGWSQELKGAFNLVRPLRRVT